MPILFPLDMSLVLTQEAKQNNNAGCCSRVGRKLPNVSHLSKRRYLRNDLRLFEKASTLKLYIADLKKAGIISNFCITIDEMEIRHLIAVLCLDIGLPRKIGTTPKSTLQQVADLQRSGRPACRGP